MSQEEEESKVVPSVAVIEEPTVVEDVVKAALVAGEESEQLSDLSEDNDYFSVLSGSKHYFSRTLSSWYRRIAPLVRNRKVRMLTILNFFLTLIALLLFFTVILLFAIVVVMKQQVALSTPKDMPCLFEWGEWSSCSSTCRISQAEATPSMRRRVKRIYHASGKFAPCPEGLRVGFEQIAPCNTQICPRKLTSFGWSECYYYIPHIGRESGCYQIRRLTTSDALIEIDGEDLIRNCSVDECPEFMT